MRILITGAAGFVGQSLVAALRPHHELAVLDQSCVGFKDASDIICLEGDVADSALLDRVRAAGPFDALIHMATLPGGATEKNPLLALRVNLQGGIGLIEAVASGGRKPRVIFASSVAAFGDNLPSTVDDNTSLQPQLLYGAHKVMMETWIGTLSRRGAIDGLSVRFPGIVARPAGAEGLKSAFMSDVFHRLREGKPFTAPVSPDATLWLMSRRRTVANLIHALSTSLDKAPPSRAVTLPAIHVSMAALVAAIASHTGLRSTVSYEPDGALEAGLAASPNW